MSIGEIEVDLNRMTRSMTEIKDKIQEIEKVSFEFRNMLTNDVSSLRARFEGIFKGLEKKLEE